MNSRRKVIIVLGASAFGISFTSAAQTPKIHRVGILFSNTKSSLSLQAFLQELRRLGYIDTQNVLIEYRFAEGKLDRLPALSSELVAEKVDVIFASNTNAVQAARQATTSIPIVFSVVSDPVGSGFVASLARPGGNITGTTSINRELAAKRLQILKEVFPKTSRVAALIADDPQVAPQLDQVQQASKRLGINILITKVLSRDDFESANNLLRSWRADSIYVIESATNSNNRKLLVEFVAQIRLPAIYVEKQYVDLGGLISYGANYEDLYRRAAIYVDKILKGAKPSDLPVEQPTTFELFINGRTAKALGIAIPQSLLISADKVIE
jgi:putative ABC transport system substrate-binding protein